MAQVNLILDFAEFENAPVLADIHEIRKYLPQRHEFEQLTAVVFKDAERMIGAGYKDITENEFWIRGHMPGMPLMPGVMMCEAAAQLCAYLALKYELLSTKHMIGFAGLDEVRFRGIVRPGNRMYIVAQLLKVRRDVMIVGRFQNFVNRALVCEGNLRGVPIPREMIMEPGRSPA